MRPAVAPHNLVRANGVSKAGQDGSMEWPTKRILFVFYSLQAYIICDWQIADAEISRG